MKLVRPALVSIALFQVASTLLGTGTLLARPDLYAPTLDPTPFAGQYGLAAFLLGVVVGGPQWIAAFVHLRRPAWLPLAHTAAGSIMTGWIAGECLVLNQFNWAHALWGGLGVVQLLLVCVLLGATRALPESGASNAC